MNKTSRAMKRLCEDVIVLDSDEERDGFVPSLSEMAKDARGILASLAPKRKAPPRPPAPRNRTAETRKVTRPERMREIREAVRERDGGCCVICGHGRPVTGECHHLISGNGRRRVHEKPETCVWVCPPFLNDCHDKAATDPDALRKIAAYCVEHGMTEAARAVAHRLDKVNEARRSPETRSAR